MFVIWLPLYYPRVRTEWQSQSTPSPYSWRLTPLTALVRLNELDSDTTPPSHTLSRLLPVESPRVRRKHSLLCIYNGWKQYEHEATTAVQVVPFARLLNLRTFRKYPSQPTARGHTRWPSYSTANVVQCQDINLVQSDHFVSNKALFITKVRLLLHAIRGKLSIQYFCNSPKELNEFRQCPQSSNV